MIRVWPVCHVVDVEQVARCVAQVRAAEAHGMMLISMSGDNLATVEAAKWTRRNAPDLLVGANFLGVSSAEAFASAAKLDLAACWSDEQVFHDGKATDGAKILLDEIESTPSKGLRFFTAIDFKGQRRDVKLEESAALAARHGLTPMTSGRMTGSPPSVEKVAVIADVLPECAPLAVASGIAPFNLRNYSGLVTDVLVNSSIRSGPVFHDVALRHLVKAGRAALSVIDRMPEPTVVPRRRGGMLGALDDLVSRDKPAALEAMRKILDENSAEVVTLPVVRVER